MWRLKKKQKKKQNLFGGLKKDIIFVPLKKNKKINLKLFNHIFYSYSNNKNKQASQMCYAVLCIFSYMAAGKEQHN